MPLECVNPVRDKWRVRWDMQEETGELANYFEAEFAHKPMVEEIESVISESGVDATDGELSSIGEILGYKPSEFLNLMEKATDERVSADPNAQLMEVVRSQQLEKLDIPDAMALRLRDTFYTFQYLCKRAKMLDKGVVFRYNGKPWRVIQAHTPQAIYPPSMATAALYTRIEPSHAGTMDDPIPYEQGMAFEKDKYYSQYGVIYLCILTTVTGYPNDLKDLPTIVRAV